MGEPESNKEYPDQTIVEVREYSICTSGISKAKQEVWSLCMVSPCSVEAVEHRPIMLAKIVDLKFKEHMTWKLEENNVLPVAA
jgi:hypothetical protein